MAGTEVIYSPFASQLGEALECRFPTLYESSALSFGTLRSVRAYRRVLAGGSGL